MFAAVATVLAEILLTTPNPTAAKAGAAAPQVTTVAATTATTHNLFFHLHAATHLRGSN